MTNTQTGPLTVDEYSEFNATELGRRRVTRRSLLKAFAGGAGGIALAQFAFAEAAFAAGGGTQGSAGVVVSGRHLSFPSGREGTPSSAMAVTAQLVSKTGTLPRGLRAWVDLGTQPGHYGSRIDADIRHLVGQYAIPGGPVGSQFYVKAAMPGLHPDTLYHYRLRLSDGTVTGDAFFTTAPAHEMGAHRRPVAKPFTFTAFGDVGTDNAPKDPRLLWGQDPAAVVANDGVWPRGVFDNHYYSATDPVAGPGGSDPTPASTMTAQMGQERPAFTLLAGDICYADPSGTGLPADDTLSLSSKAPPGKNEYNPYVWDVFLAQIEPEAAFAPWMFATGNHDMEPLYGDTDFLGGSPSHGYGGHLARLDLPTNGPKVCPSVYSFTYANVGVISVDANDLSYEIQTNTGYSHGAQLKWIESTLREWRTNPAVASSVDFIVVFFHHCVYSTTANHASDGGLRNALDGLLSTYQVDLTVAGHNHIFERTDPIKHGKKTRSAPDQSIVHPDIDGVVHFTVGSGGRPRYSFLPAPSESNPPPDGVTPDGPQALPEGQRYRGYRPPGGANTSENNTENIVNSYFWSDADTAVNAAGYPSGTKQREVVDWSQVRYDGYAFIAVDVVPGESGRTTTMTVRTIADAPPGSTTPTTEIDRITFKRVAGLSGLRLSPGRPGHSHDHGR
jgi:hypothetical protein